METTAQKLRDVLEALAPAVPKKPSMPVLSHVLLADRLATATNLEVWATLRVPEADGAPPLLIPHRRASQFLKSVPGDTRVQVEQQNGSIILRAGPTVARLDCGDPEEFPPCPEQSEEVATRVDGDALVSALTELLPYAATDDARPVLKGVCLATGWPAEACAADGFRLAYRALPFAIPRPDSDPSQHVIPPEGIRVLAHLWRVAGREPEAPPPDSHIVRLVTTRRMMGVAFPSGTTARFTFGPVSVTVSCPAGTFPDYHSLIPREGEGSGKVTFMAPDLELALRQVGLVASDASGIIRLEWDADGLTLSARGENVGEVATHVRTMEQIGALSGAEPALSLSKDLPQGGPGRIAFNLKYLAEYLKGRYQPVTVMASQGTSGPALFTSPGAPQVVIMPMFVQWGDGEPVPEADAEGDPDGGDGEPDEAPPSAVYEETEKGRREGPDETQRVASKPRRGAGAGGAPEQRGRVLRRSRR